jgi:branched-chain amino acid transport system permease protein
MHGVVAIALYDWNYFFAQLVAGLTIGSLYALLALGYTMVYGILKLLNFAHGDVYMVGAFMGFAFLSLLSPVLGRSRSSR